MTKTEARKLAKACRAARIKPKRSDRGTHLSGCLFRRL